MEGGTPSEPVPSVYLLLPALFLLPEEFWPANDELDLTSFLRELFEEPLIKVI